MAETGGGRGAGGIFCGAHFYVLPEGCIAVILSLTSARDACRLAMVSKIFKSAVDSDWLWLHFLPSDYEAILARSEEAHALLHSLSKKQLYHRLIHRPLLIDGGTKTFWLDRKTGKKCYMIAARDLNIIWGDTPRYWIWTPLPESRFSEVAELIAVCWLEIRGKIKTSLLSVGTEYAAYLVFKLTEEAYGLNTMAEASVGTTRGRLVQLDPNESRRSRLRFVGWRNGIFGMTLPPPSNDTRAGQGDDKWPKQRADGWLELKLGQFSADEEDDGEVDISLLETRTGKWKGGLIIEGIELRPNAADVDAASQ
ncbi:hypothetical protein Dimus_011920 [Dionaea muscipula]